MGALIIHCNFARLVERTYTHRSRSSFRALLILFQLIPPRMAICLCKLVNVSGSIAVHLASRPPLSEPPILAS